MLHIITQITIDTQEADGASTWFQAAAWIAGTVLFVLVVFLGFGVVQFVKGKINANSEATRKGALTAGLSLVGAILIGTASGAIAWSADSSTYDQFGGAGSGLAGLMPSGARPKEVTVDRQGVLVSCPETVSIEAENAGNYFQSSAPTMSEHQQMESVLEDNGALEGLKNRILDEGEHGAGGVLVVIEEEDALESMWGNDSGVSMRVSSVEWHPADNADGCTPDNTQAVADSTIRVSLWYGTGQSWYDDQALDEYEITSF